MIPRLIKVGGGEGRGENMEKFGVHPAFCFRDAGDVFWKIDRTSGCIRDERRSECISEGKLVRQDAEATCPQGKRRAICGSGGTYLKVRHTQLPPRRLWGCLRGVAQRL